MQEHFIKVDLGQFNLLDEFNNLGLKFKDGQICLNTIPSKPNDIYFGVGSLYYDWTTVKYDDKGSIVELKKFSDPYKESDFTVLCDQFKNTEFELAYNKMKSKYNVGRTRIMNIKSRFAMSWHQDDSRRLHYPFKTQEGCMMVIEDQVKHLKSDNWYMTDTTKKHTAFNSSREDRYHLVASILD